MNTVVTLYIYITFKLHTHTHFFDLAIEHDFKKDVISSLQIEGN